jgi:hypothetical protein
VVNITLKIKQNMAELSMPLKTINQVFQPKEQGEG